MEPEEVPTSKQDNFEMEKENNSPDKKEEITPLKEKESISESSPKEEDKLILGKKSKKGNQKNKQRIMFNM
jgi:hypothetical protein